MKLYEVHCYHCLGKVVVPLATYDRVGRGESHMVCEQCLDSMIDGVPDHVQNS
jgi:hypothetical protein